MTEGTPMKSRESLSRLADQYEALLRDFGLLRQLDELSDASLSSDELSARIVAMIATEGVADDCSIMLLIPEGTYLELRAVGTRFSTQGFAISPDFWRGKRFALGEGVAGRVAATGTPVRVSDTQADSTFINLPESPLDLRSLMCFPLEYRGEVFGVINLSHSAPAFFGREREHSMALVARRIGDLVGAARHRDRALSHDADSAPGEVREIAKISDRNGRVVQISEDCLALTGISAEDWQAGTLDWRSRIVDRDRARYDAYIAGLANNAGGISYTFQDAHGARRRFREVALPCPGSDNHVAIVRDELPFEEGARWPSSEAQTRLVQAQRIHTLGQLASGIIHELSNLLTGVVGNLELVLASESGGESRRLIERAQSASLRGADIVRKVLRFSRAGIAEGDLVPLEVAPLLAEVAEVLRCSLSPRITLETELPRDLAMVCGDGGALSQALLGLGVNARDALEERESAEGPDRPSPWTIRLGAENVRLGPDTPGRWGRMAGGEFVRIFVADTGVGMSPQVLARLYEPFFSTKPAWRGAGLGLPTAYRIARRHQGWLDVHSTPNHGTTVELYLPVYVEADTGTLTDAEPNGASPGTGLVLIVDDEPLVRNLGMAILRRLGYAALAVETGREALAAFQAREAEIALVILDMQLPDMTGETVLKELRALNADLPIVYSTGLALSEDTKWPPGLAPNGFLRKPYLIATMDEVVRGILGPGKL
jgi:signal transduction histidine kinase/CheY-like chemotaxis protein